MNVSETCDYCGELANSPYSFRHEDVWYSGHKRCMGAPMIRKLTQVTVKSAPNIALTGLMRSGKDAVAAYLTDKYGYTRFAFGDGLKDVCRVLYPDEFANGNKPRALLQGFGQDARKYDESVWTRKCFDDIGSSRERIESVQAKIRVAPPLSLKQFRVVISDLRQPSEYDRCRAESYVIIRVTAPESVRIDRAIKSSDTFNLRDLTHDTESHVGGFEVDYEIVNDGTLAELYAQIDAIMTQLTSEVTTN